MLKIIRTMRELDFGKLMQVYEEGNCENGAENYPKESRFQQIRLAEQDFYRYLQEFFKIKDAFYGVLELDGRYAAALRMEPYKDGLLLAALETAPDLRKRGYATALVEQILSFLQSAGPSKVYSHVNKRNIASLKVHARCGFCRIAEYAVYLDGSVLHSSCTLCVEMQGN